MKTQNDHNNKLVTNLQPANKGGYQMPGDEEEDDYDDDAFEKEFQRD